MLQGQFFVSQSATRYTGTLEGWRGEVTVTPQENGAICSLDFPGLAESYTFTFGEGAPGDVRDVTITSGDKTFSWQGRYWPGDAVGLWDENHNPVGLEDWLSLSTGEGNATQDSTIRAPCPIWPNWPPGTISTTGAAGSGFSLSACWRGC